MNKALVNCVCVTVHVRVVGGAALEDGLVEEVERHERREDDGEDGRPHHDAHVENLVRRITSCILCKVSQITTIL